jgi:DNA-binding protein HU-beta
VNKTELVDRVAERADLSRASAGRAVDAVFDTITQALRDSEQVVVVGFGSFQVRERGARTGRNPRTGETLEIRATRVPGFRPGKALKDALS